MSGGGHKHSDHSSNLLSNGWERKKKGGGVASDKAKEAK